MTLRLFGSVVPLLAAAGESGARGASASVSRTRVTHQLEVTAPIRVGTPPQELRCLLDSGSSDLWVPSRRCATCSNEHYFHADKSSTFQPHTHVTFSGKSKPVVVRVRYGSGSIAGFWVEDTVAIGNVQLKKQSFVIVEDTDLYPRRSWDGICGLGWKSISEAGTPLYRHLQEAGYPAIITLFPSGRSRSEAFLALGEVPESSAESITWVEAEPLREGEERSFWITSGGIAIHKDKPVPSRFLVDTGTNFLIAPARVFNTFVRSLLPASLFRDYCLRDSDGFIFCDCEATHSSEVLPVRVYLGGRPFVIEASRLFQMVHARDGGMACVLMVQSQAPGAPDTFPQPVLPSSDPFGGSPFSGPETSRGKEASAAHSPGEEGLPFSDPFAPWAPDSSKSGHGQAMPGMPPMPGGMPFPALPGWQMNDSDVITEELHPRPDGSLCVERVEVDRGKVVSNTSSCSKPGLALPGQLQVHMAPGGTSGMLVPHLSFERRLQYSSDPTAELWILGGVFLECFVAIFDFDHARIGFAESSDEVSDSFQDVQGFVRAYSQGAEHHADSAPAPADAPVVAGSMTLFTIACFAGLVCVGVFLCTYEPKRFSQLREATGHDEETMPAGAE